MKRNSFITAISAVLISPSTLINRLRYQLDRVVKGFKVENGKDRFDASITLLEGDTFFTKISSKDTNGETFLFESTRLVKGGPPLHYHEDQDEWFYILEGEFIFKIGEEDFIAKTGDSLFGPRMVPHAFSKTNEGMAKMMIMFHPAGKMEEHFIAVSKGLYKGKTEAEKRKIQSEHGVFVVGPALVHEK